MEHIFSITFIKKCMKQLKQREIKSLPEQIAFNLLMAIAPLMVLLIQLLTYFSIQTDFIEELLHTYVQNEQIVSYFTEFLGNVSDSPTNVLLMITTFIPFLWSISKGFYGISTATSTTYQVPLMRFAFLERIISFVTVCLMIILLMIVLVFSVFGQHILNLFLHVSDLYIPEFFHSLLGIFGTVIAFITYLGFFLLLFYFAPTIKLKFSEIIPGALVTAVGWSVASIGFSFYVNTLGNYSLYGSLAVAVILLLWLYLLGYMIMVGLQVNYILKRDYYGGIVYHPRLTYHRVSKWTDFDYSEENNKN